MNAEVTGNRIGIVVIGRNEGQRLMVCLRSVMQARESTVYVDSGSTDGSIEAARQMGVDVVELDHTVPFTAARARNVGVRRLVELDPQVSLVQVVDGDCEVVEGWLSAAREALTQRPDVAAVCGRRRERFPDASIYNRLADIEWNTPPGETRACGGDAMYRRSAFEQAGCFNDTLICGEEPELCVRLRAAGWKVLRLDRDMTWHDAAITRFSQWWKRLVRSGWAYAQGAAMHGRPPERHCVKPSRSIWFWGIAMPLGTLALALAWSPWALCLLLLYPLMSVRIAGARIRSGDAWGNAWRWGVFCMIGKFPQAIGQLRYWLMRALGRQATLIEYKGHGTPATLARQS